MIKKTSFNILSISILSVILLSGTVFSYQNVFAGHVVTVIETVGPTAGVKATTFTLGDAGGIFVSCDIPNQVAGDARLQILRDSPRVVLDSVEFLDVTDIPATVSTTFDITDTTTFTADTYLIGCVWQDNDDPDSELDDASHNFVSSHFLDIVEATGDTTPPTITTVTALTVEATAVNTPLADVETAGLSATVSDNVDPNPTLINDAPATFPLGDTLVTWTATDASENSAQATTTVTVQDTTAPIVTDPPNITREGNTQGGWQGDIGTATATDIFAIVDIFSNAPSLFPIDTTEVIWSATDENDNTGSTQTQLVTIEDTTEPDITAPADVRFEQGDTVVLGTPTVSDIVDPSPIVTNDAPITFPLGVTTVTWTATDASGNSATATQDVTIAEVFFDDPNGIVIEGVDSTTNSVHTPLWGSPGTIDLSGTVRGFGFAEGDQILVKIDNQDEVPSVPQSSKTLTATLTGPDVGEPADLHHWTLTFEYDDDFSGNPNGPTLEIIAILDNPGSSTVASSDPESAEVQPHVTDLAQVLADTNVKWDHTLAGNTVTLTDTSEGGVGIANKLITFTGDSVATGQSTTTADGTGGTTLGQSAVDLQAGTAQAALDGPTYDVAADFAGDSAYIASSDSDPLTLDPHVVTADLELAAPNVKWDHTLAGNTVTLTDTELIAGTDSGAALAANSELVSFTGDSVTVGQSVNLGPLVGGTASVNKDLQAGTAQAALDGPTYDVVSTHTSSNAYIGSASDATDSDGLTLDPHIVTVETTNDANVKWDHTFNAETIITDDEVILGTDSGSLLAAGGITFHYGDLGVAGEEDPLQDKTAGPLLGGTATTGPITLQAGKAADVGLQNIRTDFDGNLAYVVDSHDSPITLDPHDVTLLTTNDANVKWDHTFNAETTIIDDDAVLAGLVNSDTGSELAAGGITFHYGDLGVAGEEDPLQDKTAGPLADNLAGDSTATTGPITLQAGKAADVGLQNIRTDFDGTPQYNSATVDSAITLDPHDTTTVTTVTEDSVLWDHVFHATTVITDNDGILTPNPVNADTGSELGVKTFTYSGLGVAGEDDQSHTTTGPLTSDGTVSTATTGEIALQAGEAADVDGVTPQDVIATFAGTPAYVGSADTTDSIVLDKHATTTSLDSLVDLVAGTSYTPSGLVEDDNRVLQNDAAIRTALGCDPDPLVEACPNFVNFDTGSLENLNVRLEGTGIFDDNKNSVPSRTVTTQGVTVNDPSGQFTTNNGVDVLQLSSNGKLVTPSGSVGVTLDIRNLGLGQTATFTVLTEDNEVFDVVAEGVDSPNFVNLLITEASGISEITFNPTEDDVSNVEISAIRLSNSEGDPPIFFDLDFSTLPDNELVLRSGIATFNAGAYHDIIPTPDTEATDLTVQAFFDATDQFNASDSPQREFDTLFQSWGVGGQNVAIAPDSGQGFTSVACSVDTDEDALCDNWENDGFITYNLGGGATDNWGFPITTRPVDVVTPGPLFNHKDVYVEIDYMGPASGDPSHAGHKPADVVIFDLVKNFQLSPTSNPDGTTGINLHLEIDDQIPHVSALNVWTDNDNILTNDFNSIKSRFFGTVNERTVLGPQTTTINNIDANTNELIISGVTVTTPSVVDKTRGVITIQTRVVFSGDPGTITHGDAIRTGSSNSATFNIPGKFIGETFTRDFSQPNAYIFTITAPFSDSDVEANPNNFNMGTFTLTIDTTNDVSIVTTPGTTGTYRNSPTVSTSLLDSKAQVVHYALIVHSIGECGPSGVAEFIGNDMIISLGCNFSGAEQGISAVDANGNANTIGSRWEFDGTFVHELGHNLGLQHGGSDNINCKPNYESVMSYARQTPIFLGTPFPVQYSSGLLPSLNENGALEEFEGLQRTGAHGKIVYAGSGGSARITTTYDSILDRVSIDWNDDGIVNVDDILTSADINNFEISGCGASPGQTMTDHDDWNNMNFNFRGAGGSAFDGFKVDPRKTAEVTDTIVDELEATQDWYNGILDPVPREGSTEENDVGFKIGSTIPLKFELFSCNPADVLCVDVNGLAGEPETFTGAEGEEEMIEFTDADKQIFLQVKKFAGGSLSDGVEVQPEDGEPDVGFFRHTGEHFIFNWDTKQLLDPNAKGNDKKDNLAQAAGTYALRFIELQDGIEVGFLSDRFEENNIKIFQQRLPADLDLNGDGIADEDADEIVTVILELTP